VQPNAQGTQGYDPYAYVANNPVSRTDPSGQEALPEDPGDVPRVLLRVLERTGETMARTPYAPLWEVAIALAEQIGIALVLAFFVFVVMTFVTLVLACLAERGITGGSTGDCTIVVGAAKSAWDWATGAARSAAESVAETAKSWAEDSCPKDTVPVPSDDGLYRCEKPAEPNWVVRGGTASADNLKKAAKLHPEVGVYGISVQYHPGATIEELARAGQFPHPKISVTAAEVLIGAGQAAGYEIALVDTPGPGYHHDIQVPEPMPDDLAQALASVFTQQPNPAQVKP
jgi:hypothetical protein